MARRPHELFATLLEAGSCVNGHEGMQFSLLGIAALRQAIRVLGSAKMASHSKAAIAGFVSGLRCVWHLVHGLFSE